MDHREIIDFWFVEIDQEHWWKKDQAFDELCRARYAESVTRAAAGEFFRWRDCATGRLAEVILLDQIPRNIYRDTPRSFATDSIALVLAQEAVRLGADQQLENNQQRAFLYMPYMHSESALIHEEAVRLYASEGMDPESLDFEYQHKRIIDRFGRYPHRNRILGRPSTRAELAFLENEHGGF